MSYVDAHLHLADPTYADRVTPVIQEAEQSGVTKLLSNGVDYDTSTQTISLAKQHEKLVLAAVGVHPWTILNYSAYKLSRFERLLEENRGFVKAIGEIGLDGKYPQDAEKRRRQLEVFRIFLEIADRRRLPVVVHSRLAVDEVLGELSRFNPPSVLMHWYDGPVEKLGVIRDSGYMISIGPTLLYSKHLFEVAREADLSMILTETDAPVTYHGPFEGKATEPGFVVEVIRKLAEIKHEQVDVVRDAVWRNFQRLLGAEPVA